MQLLEFAELQSYLSELTVELLRWEASEMKPRSKVSGDKFQVISCQKAQSFVDLSINNMLLLLDIMQGIAVMLLSLNKAFWAQSRILH